MKKSNLTPDQQALFNANFNRRAFERAKEPIHKALSESKTFDEFWDRIKNYDRDIEFEDDFTIITCEVELDRSHMETEGDYVGACFYIKWSDETNTGSFDKVALFSSEPSGEYVADLLCYINPETCEVTEWVYGA